MATFAGSSSMRVNYELGVDHYYSQHGSSYRNPHMPGIMAAASEAMQLWMCKHLLAAHPELQGQVVLAAPCLTKQPSSTEAAAAAASTAISTTTVSNEAQDGQSSSCDVVQHDGEAAQGPCSHAPAVEHSSSQQQQAIIAGPCLEYGPGAHVRVLDLACGSGEASQAITACWVAAALKQHMAKQQQQLGTDGTAAMGADGLILQPLHDSSASDSISVDEQATTAAASNAAAANAVIAQDQTVELQPAEGPQHGSQQHAQHCLQWQGPGLQLCIDASDPYTQEAFHAWTGRSCEAVSFQDVGAGWLVDHARTYHLCVCSYAMHVLDPSYLFPTLQQLALACEALLIISPHKLPKVEPHTGWQLVEQCVVQRVHARLYTSAGVCHPESLELHLVH